MKTGRINLGSGRVRIRRSRTAEIQLTSTSDIAFLLLIFFLATAVFVSQMGLPLVLPPAGSTPMTVSESEILVLELSPTGELSWQGETLATESLTGWARERERGERRAHLCSGRCDGVSVRVRRRVDRCVAQRLGREHLVPFDGRARMRTSTRFGVRAQIPSASMADLALLLLVFFMTTTFFQVERGPSVDLPGAAAFEERSREDAILLHVTPQGSVYWNGVEQDIASLGARVEQERSEKGVRRILLFADRATPFDRVFPLLQGLRGSSPLPIVLAVDPNKS